MTPSPGLLHVRCGGAVLPGPPEAHRLPGRFCVRCGSPGVMMMVVTVTTIITTIKLRQAAVWRAETSSSGSITTQEIALTRMLVGNSVLFIVCVFPIAAFRLVSFRKFVRVVVFPIASFRLFFQLPYAGCCLPRDLVQVAVFPVTLFRLLSSPRPCSGCSLLHELVQVAVFSMTLFRLLSSP